MFFTEIIALSCPVQNENDGNLKREVHTYGEYVENKKTKTNAIELRNAK